MTSLLEKKQPSDVLQPIETDLLRDTDGAAVEWYGRAATALYRAFTVARHIRGARAGEGEVILPSISCATPANAALLAGVTPRFADVDSATGMPTLDTIRERWTPQTCAVVFIHLFGQTQDLRSLAQWCRANDILLIEDLAQSLGARLPDAKSAGSFGDLSVYSFNPTKILECGGGALLVRSDDLAHVCRELMAADPLPAEVDDGRAKFLALSYRNLHHSLVGLLRTGASDDVSTAFLKLQPGFRELYLRRMKDPSALSRAWIKLPLILKHRYENAQSYEAALKHGPWKTIRQWQESGVCWRYSLLVDFPEKLVDFSEAVRHDGFHVSNLYWPVNDFFRPSDRCPNANDFARRVVNLWVDPSVDRQWVERCAASVLRNASQFAL